MSVAALDEALALIEEGFTVLPAHPINKMPLLNSWRQYQEREPTSDEYAYWTSSAKFKGCNWAIVTGRQINVVDADSAEAEIWIKENLPYTPRTVRTGRGRHFYYRATDLKIPGSTNADAKIDIRGRGGIVIAPGSVHQNGSVYTTELDLGMDGDWRDLPELSPADISKVNETNHPPKKEFSFQIDQTGGWHDRMIREVASKVMLQYTDEQILAEASSWTESGYTVDQTIKEFKVAIAGARKKWADQLEHYESKQEAQREALAPRALEIGEVAAIPPRQWLYGRHYIRNFLSVTVAAGGTGKTAVTLAEAMAMATGRPLLGIETDKRRVWVWNLEDPIDELRRRFAAISQHYLIEEEEYKDHLYVNSSRDGKMIMAESVSGEPVIMPVADIILGFIKTHKIDVVIVDPFVSSHRLNENDNGAMDLVVKAWGRIAEQGNCSIELVHHVRKAQAGQGASYGDARGASALTDAARHVRRLTRMTADEARYADVDEGEFWRYSREADSKDNLAPPAGDNSWRQMISEELPNGDNVGVVAAWEWPDAFADVTASDLGRIQTRLREGEHREDVRSSMWAGLVVADVMDMDASEPGVRAKIKHLLKTWIDNRELQVVERLCPKGRRDRRFIELGEKFYGQNDR